MWLPHQAAAIHAVVLSWLQSFGHALEGKGEGEGWGGWVGSWHARDLNALSGLLTYEAQGMLPTCLLSGLYTYQ